MKALEPGMRVYVGWASKCGTEAKPEMCQQGILVEGPFPPRECYYETNWDVDMDSGFQGTAIESIIFPIDDDDQQDIIEHKELETVE